MQVRDGLRFRKRIAAGMVLTAMLVTQSVTAQEKGAAGKEKTVDRTPVTYVGGNRPLAPNAVVGVRQRIDALNGRSRRTIQPVIILVPSGSGADSVSGLPNSTGFDFSAQPRSRNLTLADLDRLENRLMQRIDQRMDELFRRFNQQVEVRQEVGVDPLVQTPVQPPPVSDAVPTVETVEVALLETGLFRTTAILFEFDSDRLLESSEATLAIIGDVLQRHPEIAIEVLGHTDSVGTEEYNQSLSERRAASVRAFLAASMMVAPERMVATGMGERNPIAPNATTTGRALNRRVEFRVIESGDSEN